MQPYYDEAGITIYHGDCREVVAQLPVDLVVTDPPYPNNAGHFLDGIEAAEQVMKMIECPRWFVFWHQLVVPSVPLPLVAHHIWHRTNTNRPDNYEPIYEFAEDGREHPSMVFPYPVIYPGLTGCVEATGHPTQKNVRLMRRLLQLRTFSLVVDPFMGSGTTLRAAKDLGFRAIGIDTEERYCEIAARRLGQEVFDFGAA